MHLQASAAGHSESRNMQIFYLNVQNEVERTMRLCHSQHFCNKVMKLQASKPHSNLTNSEKNVCLLKLHVNRKAFSHFYCRRNYCFRSGSVTVLCCSHLASLYNFMVPQLKCKWRLTYFAALALDRCCIRLVLYVHGRWQQVCPLVLVLQCLIITVFTMDGE
jgi:hypothetical protein